MSDSQLARFEAEAATLSFSEAVSRLDKLHDEGRGDSDEAEIIRNCPAFEAGKVILRGGELTLVEGDVKAESRRSDLAESLRADLAEAMVMLRALRCERNADDGISPRIDALLARHPCPAPEADHG